MLVAVIIKVKVSAPRSSQAAAETQCWLQSHNVSLSLLGRLPRLQPANPPPSCCCWYSAAAAVQHWWWCGKTAAAAENFLRAFRARSRDAADRDGVFSDDGQHTRERGVATLEALVHKGAMSWLVCGVHHLCTWCRKCTGQHRGSPDRQVKTCSNPPFPKHLLFYMSAYLGEGEAHLEMLRCASVFE